MKDQDKEKTKRLLSIEERFAPRVCESQEEFDEIMKEISEAETAEKEKMRKEQEPYDREIESLEKQIMELREKIRELKEEEYSLNRFHDIGKLFFNLKRDMHWWNREWSPANPLRRSSSCPYAVPLLRSESLRVSLLLSKDKYSGRTFEEIMDDLTEKKGKMGDMKERMDRVESEISFPY